MDDAGDHLERMIDESSSSTRMRKKRIFGWFLMVTQVSTAVSPSAFGALPVTELKMLTSTRNKVTSNAIRPGIVKLFNV